MNIASQALSVTGIGLLIVFVALIILIACITILSVVMSEKKKKAEKPAPATAAAPAPVVEAPAAPVVEMGIDPQVIAVISAAIAAFDGGNKTLVVRSVRRAPAWQKAARAEQVYRF